MTRLHIVVILAVVLTDAEFQPGQSDWKACTDLCGEPAGMSADFIRFLIQ